MASSRQTFAMQRSLSRVRAQVEATLPFTSECFATDVTGEVIEHVFDAQAVVGEAGLTPLGRWTNAAHFSMFGSSEFVGRLRPSLGHTLISLAAKQR